MATSNCQYSTRYCWDADKVKALIRLRAELSPLFTGKRNASKYAWAVVERELDVPLPLSKIIKKWNNLLQEYKAIKISEEPKRREWPFFTLMDVYFSDQVNDPSLRLFSSTKTLKESLDESVFEDDPIVASAIAAATSGAFMEIDELVKRQKERRSNEIKCTVETNFNVKATDYNNSGNKLNALTEKPSMADQHKDPPNNCKGLSDLLDIKNNKPAPLNPLYSEIPSPTPHIQNKCPDSNTIDQYLLSWNNFLGNMSRGFHTLQKDEKMVDVTIAAGGKIFKAHKLVLSVCSPYFQEIFLENPSNHPILLMADVEANHMAGLLNFMYSGQVNVKYEDLPVFLKVAEAMKIKGLHTEKPEGQDFKEIQFSREECPNPWSPSTAPVAIHNSGHKQCTPSKNNEESSFDSLGSVCNPQAFCRNMDTFCLDQDNSNFSIMNKNIPQKNYQKCLTKRKNMLQCENDSREKNIINTLGCPFKRPSKMLKPQMLPIIESFNSNEVLDLAQNGFQKLHQTKSASSSAKVSEHFKDDILIGNDMGKSAVKDEGEFRDNCNKLSDTTSMYKQKNKIYIKNQRVILQNDNKNNESIKSNDDNNNNEIENNNFVQTDSYIDNDSYKQYKTVLTKKLADNNNNVFLTVNANTDVSTNVSEQQVESEVKEEST